jgi:hypothetical protein
MFINHGAQDALKKLRIDDYRIYLTFVLSNCSQENDFLWLVAGQFSFA